MTFAYSSRNPEDEDVLRIHSCTKAIVFFSTPHRGGNGPLPCLQNPLTSFFLFILRNPKNDYLKLLRRDSDECFRIESSFCNVASDMLIATFYERLPLKSKLFGITIFKRLVNTSIAQRLD